MKASMSAFGRDFPQSDERGFQETSDDLLLANDCFYSFSDKKIMPFIVRSAQETSDDLLLANNYFYSFSDKKISPLLSSLLKKPQTISYLQVIIFIHFPIKR
jgi:hypothetical protein